jgi:hypothetical protein
MSEGLRWCGIQLVGDLTAIAGGHRLIAMSPVRAFAAFLLLYPVITVAGEASGEFTVTKRPPIRPKYAAAFETRDPSDAHKKVVEVVLSEEPVDVAGAIAELDPHTNLINQKALFNHNYILLWVRPDGDISMNATYSDTMTQYMDRSGGTIKTELTTNTPDKVAGRFSSIKPLKTMSGDMYTIDLKFSTDVARGPAGTRLPADGGEPGKAYKALQASIAKKSWSGISKSVTPKTLTAFYKSDRTEKENLDDAIETLGFRLPKGAGKLTGGELRGDTAILEVEAEIFQGQNGIFFIRMVKDGSRWLFDQATRVGMID